MNIPQNTRNVRTRQLFLFNTDHAEHADGALEQAFGQVGPLQPEVVQHPEVPWALIAGMRDKLIHGYDMVDLELVWQTVDNDVPALLSLIEPLLPKQK